MNVAVQNDVDDFSVIERVGQVAKATEFDAREVAAHELVSFGHREQFAAIPSVLAVATVDVDRAFVLVLLPTGLYQEPIGSVFFYLGVKLFLVPLYFHRFNSGDLGDIRGGVCGASRHGSADIYAPVNSAVFSAEFQPPIFSIDNHANSLLVVEDFSKRFCQRNVLRKITENGIVNFRISVFCKILRCPSIHMG